MEVRDASRWRQTLHYKLWSLTYLAAPKRRPLRAHLCTYVIRLGLSPILIPLNLVGVLTLLILGGALLLVIIAVCAVFGHRPAFVPGRDDDGNPEKVLSFKPYVPKVWGVRLSPIMLALVAGGAWASFRFLPGMMRPALVFVTSSNTMMATLIALLALMAIIMLAIMRQGIKDGFLLTRDYIRAVKERHCPILDFSESTEETE